MRQGTNKEVVVEGHWMQGAAEDMGPNAGLEAVIGERKHIGKNAMPLRC